MLEINWNPPASQLRVFAVLQCIFFSILAWFLLPRGEAHTVPIWVTSISMAAAVVGLLRPSLLRPIYVIWMVLVFPIGWVVSHALMAGVYYLLISPIGLGMRLVGYDPMDRKRKPDADSYWKTRANDSDVKRYFRPF